MVSFGLISIHSSSLGHSPTGEEASNGDNFANFYKQAVFFALGLILMFVLSFLDWRTFREGSYLVLIIYFFCLLGLIGLFLFAPAIRGVKSWYKIGSFSLDPVEFTKIVLAIVLAKYFSFRHVEVYRIRHLALSGLYVFLPSVLVFLQPDLGSVLILITLWLGTLIVSGIRVRHFFFLFLCGLLILILSWGFLLKDYQRQRIVNFVVPSSDPLGANWSQNQAKISIGSGGLLGQGLGKGSQTQYGFLPEPQNDFIFSAIAEETGLLGVFVLFILFSIFLWRIFKIVASSQSNFPRLFSTGFAIILIAQIFIHIGMNLGILPIIGISLPFVSYGGSGLIANLMGLGILLNIKNNP